MGTTLVDEGDGTTTECHQIYTGDGGPRLIPVNDTIDIDTDENGENGTPVPAHILRTSSQLIVETQPLENHNVLRLVDFTDGSLEELIIGDLRIRSQFGSGVGYIDLRVAGEWVNKMEINNNSDA